MSNRQSISNKVLSRSNVVNYLRTSHFFNIVDFVCHKPASNNEAAFTFNIEQHFHEHPEAMEEVMLSMICHRRDEHGDFVPKGPNSNYPWKKFVAFLDNPGGSLTDKDLSTFASNVVTGLNQISRKIKHTFGSPKFRLGDDLTNHYDPDSPLDAFYLDMEVVEIVMSLYPGKSIDELVVDKDIMKASFRGDNPSVKFKEAHEELIAAQEAVENDSD